MLYLRAKSLMAVLNKPILTQDARERLVEFFGLKGAEVVISHLEDLEQAFGSSASVIRTIMKGDNRGDTC